MFVNDYDFRSFELQQLILGWGGKNKLYMLRALALIAHKTITINWLKPHPPGGRELCGKLNFETATLKGCLFRKTISRTK